jgi:lipopolysaccharide/colanic/teichoic acid biosynthesis glycosyltransferase
MDSAAQSRQFEPGANRRVTRLGAFLRRTKLDEVPELFNVLFGDMSLVGPRPEVEKYIQFYPNDFKEILKVRPGLSDFASVKYRNEEEILAKQADPEEYYIKKILPEKLKLATKYVEEISFRTDLKIIANTLKSIFVKS